MAQRIHGLHDLPTSTQTVTTSAFKSEGRTIGGVTAPAPAKDAAAPNQPVSQVGTNVHSNINFGGKQKAGNIKFGEVKEIQNEILAPAMATKSMGAVQVGHNYKANVLHPGSEQDVQELTFG